MADFTNQGRAFVNGAEVDQVFVVGEEAEFVFGRGTQIYPRTPVQLYGTTSVRMTNDAAGNWFDFGFRIDTALSGNAGAGWTDAGNYLRLEIQYSLDLINWSMGKFLPAPVPVVDLGDGVFEYWGRSVHPQDAAIKTGALYADQTNGDSRNGPFTSLVVAGVALALPHFPYNLSVAGTAAQMSADISAFYPGAVVTGTSAATWSISIPSVDFTAIGQYSKVGWPGYLTPDMYGNLVNTIDSRGFDGAFVTAGGMAIYNQRAFARLKISAGNRYNAYL